jgi:hypothetical protein
MRFLNPDTFNLVSTAVILYNRSYTSSIPDYRSK